MCKSACGRLTMKPYSHHDFVRKEQCPHIGSHEQNKAFCISELIVPQTKPVRLSRRLGRFDERKYLSACRGRGVLRKVRQTWDKRVDAYMLRCVYVRAVADTDYLTPLRNQILEQRIERCSG